MNRDERRALPRHNAAARPHTHQSKSMTPKFVSGVSSRVRPVSLHGIAIVDSDWSDTELDSFNHNAPCDAKDTAQ
jgi:hypothetical protein